MNMSDEIIKTKREEEKKNVYMPFPATPPPHAQNELSFE